MATLVAGAVEGLEAGVYRFDPSRHALEDVWSGDARGPLAGATLDATGWIAASPMLVLLSADLTAARTRFHDQPAEHGEQFVWLEAGCATQNAYLWAAERGLGTVLIAGLDEERAARATEGLLPRGHRLLGILPVGRPSDANAPSG